MINKKFIYYLLSLIFLISLDQLSKGFFIQYLKTQTGYIYEVLPILDFVYSWNYGISFGLFSQYYQYSNITFLILNSIIICYLIFLLKQSKSLILKTGFICIISGAIGNLLDRIFRGGVFDFIYFHYQDYAFPAFNVADSYITIGACFVIYYYAILNPESKK